MKKTLLIATGILFSFSLSSEYIMKASKVNINEYFVESSNGSCNNCDDLATYGEYNNIAFIGTNGLTQSSYSYSTMYHLDTNGGAFDDHGEGHGTYQNLGVSKVGRGGWTASNSGTSDEWIQVDFGEGKNIQFNGFVFRPYIFSSIVYGAPNEVTIKVSNDGTNFTDVQSFNVLNQGAEQVFNFNTQATGRYFRFHMDSASHDNYYLTISELEIF